MKKLAALILLTFALGVHAECTLKMSSDPVTLHNFGRTHLTEFRDSYIWFSPDAGNLLPPDLQGHSADLFNFNTLYRLTDWLGRTWYFRFAGAAWFPDKQRMGFYEVAWADGKRPNSDGHFRIEAVESPRPQTGGKTFATVGDSMVWFGEGQDFRCSLAQALPGYRFVGSNTDHYGYGHDGHGGDSSGEVLARVKDVGPADVYFVLAGSNDGGYHPDGTARNIAGIVTALLGKKADSRVIVSTLPVRGDQYADLVPKRNAAIHAWYAGCACHDRVTLIDTAKAMASEHNALKRFIMPDQIHPSPEGYRFLSGLIAATVSPAKVAGR